MLWVSDPEGYDVVFRIVPLSLEYQFFFSRTVYTCLEDNCFYLGDEREGSVHTWTVVFFFSFSSVDQFNENHCLSLQALCYFQTQLLPLRWAGKSKCSALLQIRPFILRTPHQVKIFLVCILCTKVGMTEPSTSPSWILPEAPNQGRNEWWGKLPSPAGV